MVLRLASEVNEAVLTWTGVFVDVKVLGDEEKVCSSLVGWSTGPAPVFLYLRIEQPHLVKTFSYLLVSTDLSSSGI